MAMMAWHIDSLRKFFEFVDMSDMSLEMGVLSASNLCRAKLRVPGGTQLHSDPKTSQKLDSI